MSHASLAVPCNMFSHDSRILECGLHGEIARGIIEQWVPFVCPMKSEPRRSFRLVRKTGGQADKRAARKVSFDWTVSRNDIGPRYLREEKAFDLPRECRDNVLQTAGEVRSAKVKRSAATWTQRAR